MPDPRSLGRAFAATTGISLRERWLAELAAECGFDQPGIADGAAHRRALLDLFRAYHGMNVKAASPFALDLLAHAGFDHADTAWRLSPDAPWRPWLCGPRSPFASRYKRRRAASASPLPAAAYDRAAFLFGGCRLEDRGGGAKRLGVRFSPHGFQVAASFDGAEVRSDGGLILISTTSLIPEILRSAAVGRRACEVFDHPCLAGRDYPIVHQCDLIGLVGRRPAWTIVARAGAVPWRPPWASWDASPIADVLGSDDDGGGR